MESAYYKGILVVNLFVFLGEYLFASSNVGVKTDFLKSEELKNDWTSLIFRTCTNFKVDWIEFLSVTQFKITN